MNYPKFFDAVPSIELQDPLSAFLGVFEGGMVTISYIDCVKLAGHSCPTVAGAYLMALQGLERLYPEGTPQRGGIRVEMRDTEASGVTGVIATALSFVTGASTDAGFKGINGMMSRRNLLSYDAPITREVRLTRLDTGLSVELDYDPSTIPPALEMQTLMKKMMQKSASDEEKLAFGKLWQERVERILLSPERWGEMITIS